MKSRTARGYTLIELMIVTGILFVLASITYPRVYLVLERAHQARAKNELGSLRSALGLYYSANEGRIPFVLHPNGVASDTGESMTSVLCPDYMNKLPTPKLADRFDFPFSGSGLLYDQQAVVNMSKTPPWDIYFFSGPQSYLMVNRPYVYDPSEGKIYYCNGNYDTKGEFFYLW